MIMLQTISIVKDDFEIVINDSWIIPGILRTAFKLGIWQIIILILN